MFSSLCLPGDPWHRRNGFTLTELMIVVAVIGIIASIAYPSYMRYVERSRLSDGKAGLMQAAGEMERCYTSNYSYEEGCLKTKKSSEGVYPEIALTESGSIYRLEAKKGINVPVNCETLWIQSDGKRGPESCW